MTEETFSLDAIDAVIDAVVEKAGELYPVMDRLRCSEDLVIELLSDPEKGTMGVLRDKKRNMDVLYFNPSCLDADGRP